MSKHYLCYLNIIVNSLGRGRVFALPFRKNLPIVTMWLLSLNNHFSRIANTGSAPPPPFYNIFLFGVLCVCKRMDILCGCVCVCIQISRKLYFLREINVIFFSVSFLPNALPLFTEWKCNGSAPAPHFFSIQSNKELDFMDWL